MTEANSTMTPPVVPMMTPNPTAAATPTANSGTLPPGFSPVGAMPTAPNMASTPMMAGTMPMMNGATPMMTGVNAMPGMNNMGMMNGMPGMGPNNMMLASFGDRLAAAFLDAIIMMIPLAICSGIAYGIFGTTQLGRLVGLLPGAAYYIMLPASEKGGTFGKQIMKIKIVDLNGNPIDYSKSILRYFGTIISSLPLGLGYFWVLFDDKRQAWHDKIAGTYVVKG